MPSRGNLNTTKITIPIAPLKIIALKSFNDFGKNVNEHLICSRHSQVGEQKNNLSLLGYEATNYLVDAACPRFGSGEAKGHIKESIRGSDLYILVDVMNYTNKYKISGEETLMSPDDNFQDVKRIIAAANGAHRINVIMPFIYEGRQHKRSKRESLDCAVALQELSQMGVKNIITFDAHDPRVQNAIPIRGFDNFFTTYQMISALFEHEKSIQLDSDHFMVVSPDEGGMSRSVYYANVLGVDMGMFYKRRDYSVIVNGKNPIVAHEFLGTSVEGKDILITDDMISSGDSMLAIARELKKRKARKIYMVATFGLFNEGFDKFDQLYEEGIFDRIFTTNLSYCSPELCSKPYYTKVDLTKYISLIIDTLNHDMSVFDIMNPTKRIQEVVDQYKRV